MKIEQLLVQHFYNCGEITLQGMGTFILSPDFVMPKENEKDAEIPDHAISFQYNARATADDALVDYIVQQTRKMRALAAADLDSYLVLGKQFLNIGKAFKIEGMGMLSKNQTGELVFTKGTSFHARLETIPAALKEKQETIISFNSDEKKSNFNSRKILISSLMVIGIGLIGSAVWYFFFKDKKTANPVSQTIRVVLPDTAKPAITTVDSLVKPKPESPAATDGYTFKVVFMITRDSNAAVSRMNTLISRGHKIIMSKHDSLRYKLAEPFTLPLSDTTHIKDSLNNFYYSGRGFIELK